MTREILVIAIADESPFSRKERTSCGYGRNRRRIADELDQQATQLDSRGNTRPRGNHRVLKPSR
jgi:hypothetical protein